MEQSRKPWFCCLQPLVQTLFCVVPAFYDFIERTVSPAASKPKHFRFIFNSMSNLVVILYPAWTWPTPAVVDTLCCKEAGSLGAPWVGRILLMMLIDLKFEPFQTPQQRKQHKLKGRPLPDVTPAAVFDRQCFIASGLTLFSLKYTLKCSVPFC